MRRWIHAPAQCLCGGCGASVKRGEPVQLWTLPGVTRVLKRCETCAGETFCEPAPVPVPREVFAAGFEADDSIEPVSAMLKGAMARFTREPGEDDV